MKASMKFKKEQDGSMLTYFLPGSHIRISPSLLNPKSWLFATHPYTIASLDHEEYVDLVIKKSTRFAQHLASQRYFCYTVSLPFPAFDDFFFSRNLNDNITIVCGGSGLAFGIPLFKYFHQRNRKGDEELVKTPNVRFCIVVRRKEDLFVLQEAGIFGYHEDPESDSLELTPDYRDAKIDIHVTGSSEPVKRQTLISRIKAAIQRFRKQPSETQYYQMEDLQEPMLEAEDAKASVADNGVAVEFQMGRPNVASLLGEFHEGTEEESSIVVACGPETLLADCGVWCHHNNVEFAAESFSV